MFNHIPFYINEVPDNMNTATIEQMIAFPDKAFQQNGFSEINLKEIKQIKGLMKNLDFYISGYFQIFQIPPISTSVKNQLFYLNDFSIHHMKTDFFTNRSFIDSYLLYYTYEGHGKLTYQGKTYYLGPGDGFFIDGKNPHHYQCIGDSWVFCSIDLKGANMQMFYDQFALNKRSLFTEDFDSRFQTLLEELLGIYNIGTPYRDWQASCTINQLLTHILTISYNESSRTVSLPNNMQYLIRYIENNFTSALSLDYLAHFSGISKSHLSREFKKYTGFAPNEYIIQLRLNEAKKILLGSQKPISKIAYDVGFHDINNFTNLFKKNTGVTPGAFRRSNLFSKI